MTNRTLKITMKVENQDGEVTEMVRNLKEYEQGETECNLVCMFSDWLRASNEFCETSVGIRLPIHFDEVEHTEELKKRLV